MNTGDESAVATGPAPDGIRSAGTRSRAELIGQMQSLHRSMEDAAASSSPLGQRLVADLRAGTYQRLAPMVQALDVTFEPAPHPRAPEAEAGAAVAAGDPGRGVLTADPHQAEERPGESDGTVPPATTRRTRAVQWLRARAARTGKHRATP